jgi:molybdopterin-guanine dinucleotide biosynthesis protein A
MISFTAVLFAGGESRRMGADKATLIFNGEPLWSHQLTTLKELLPEKILVSARTKPPWCPPEIENILDAPPSCGPLGGLAAALQKISTTHLLALAIDLPQMTPEHLQHLLGQARPGVGVMPVLHGQREPLCAIYPAEAREFAATAIANGDFALYLLAKTLAAKNLLREFPASPQDARLYFNVNTTADFSRL